AGEVGQFGSRRGCRGGPAPCHSSLEAAVALEHRDLHSGGIWTGTLHDQFPGPPVVADQAVPATGLDRAAFGEPELPPPLLDSGPLRDSDGSLDLVEQDPIAVHQLTSEAFHRRAPHQGFSASRQSAGGPSRATWRGKGMAAARSTRRR